MIRGILLIFLLVSIGYRLYSPCPNLLTSTHSIYVRFRQSLTHLLKSSPRNPCLATLCLLLAGEIELNPGPRSIYLCGICDQEVTWKCKGICCDNEHCNVWFHHVCVDVDSVEYVLLGKSNVSWLCPRCDNVNCDSFTFNSFKVSCHNFFSPLAELNQHHSLHSISSSDPFSPKHTSSPRKPSRHIQPPSRNNTRYQSSPSRQSTRQSSLFNLPRRANLRILNINCQSVKNKATEFLTALH